MAALALCLRAITYHHGDADGFIQHHELQDLGGAFACLISECEIALDHVSITA
jgi:hypothetical protein